MMSNQNLISSTAPIIRRTHQDTPVLTRKKAQNSEESLIINSATGSGGSVAGDRTGLGLNKLNIKSIDDGENPTTSERNDIHLRQLSSDYEEDDPEEVGGSDEDSGELIEDDDGGGSEAPYMITGEEPSSSSAVATTTIDNINHTVAVKKRNNNGIDSKTKKQLPKSNVKSSLSSATVITAADKGSDHVSIGKKRKETIQETTSGQVGNKNNAEVEKIKQIKRVKKTPSTTPTDVADISQRCQHCIVNRQCAKSLLKTIEEILSESFVSRDDNGQ